MSALGYRLGVSGALLGIVAGLIQWAFGDDIPDWTGNKLHPVRLGLVTIALSVMALGCVGFLGRDRGAPKWQLAMAGLGIVATAGICFTTVGLLWWLPGPLLIASAVLLLRGQA